MFFLLRIINSSKMYICMYLYSKGITTIDSLDKRVLRMPALTISTMNLKRTIVLKASPLEMDVKIGETKYYLLGWCRFHVSCYEPRIELMLNTLKFFSIWENSLDMLNKYTQNKYILVN